MDSKTLVVLCSCPDQETATSMANYLVNNRLAACVNISSPVKSIYRWQGEIETTEEVTLLIKTSASCYDKLEMAILDRHPYELPEIIAVPVEKGLQNYLGWINQCTQE